MCARLGGPPGLSRPLTACPPLTLARTLWCPDSCRERRGPGVGGPAGRLARGRALPAAALFWVQTPPPAALGSWRVAPHRGPGRLSAAMSGRSVPHAHPATAEYEFANPSRLGEQRFGEGLLPEEILTPTLYHGYYVRPRATGAGEGSRAGASELRLSEGKFQVFLDVSHFTPDEVTVRTVDNLLEVSARHPQRLDRHGFVSREFCRTYVLPADVDPWRVRAALSHDGILSLEAPRGGRHLDTEVNEVYISLLPPPPDPQEEEEAAPAEP